MKTIKALTAFASLTYSAASGQVISCPDDFAEDMIRAGYAVEIPVEPEPEQKPHKTARKRK